MQLWRMLDGRLFSMVVSILALRDRLADGLWVVHPDNSVGWWSEHPTSTVALPCFGQRNLARMGLRRLLSPSK
jgi:hypothetical protein